MSPWAPSSSGSIRPVAVVPTQWLMSPARSYRVSVKRSPSALQATSSLGYFGRATTSGPSRARSSGGRRAPRSARRPGRPRRRARPGARRTRTRRPRPAPPRARASGPAEREEEDHGEHHVNDLAAGGLRGQRPGGELVSVHEELEDLDDEIADEDPAERGAGRVPREPVDHTDADERDADVARDDERLVRGGQAEAGEHLRGKERESEPEDDRQDGADLQGELRASRAQGYRRRRAVPTGFEPAISSLTGTYARPLHHGTIAKVARFSRSPRTVHSARERARVGKKRRRVRFLSLAAPPVWPMSASSPRRALPAAVAASRASPRSRCGSFARVRRA